MKDRSLQRQRAPVWLQLSDILRGRGYKYRLASLTLCPSEDNNNCNITMATVSIPTCFYSSRKLDILKRSVRYCKSQTFWKSQMYISLEENISCSGFALWIRDRALKKCFTRLQNFKIFCNKLEDFNILFYLFILFKFMHITLILGKSFVDYKCLHYWWKQWLPLNSYFISSVTRGGTYMM